LPDARAIAEPLQEKEVKLALGIFVYDPTDPMGNMVFSIRATFADFEADLIRKRTREGMAIARAKSKLRGKQPKLSEKNNANSAARTPVQRHRARKSATLTQVPQK